MSESSVISKLQQAKNCAGKCDCCDKLQSQINNLSQQLNNLDNRFVNKNEFQLYKQNVESSFNELRYAFIDIESRLDKLDVGKVGFQNVSWVDDRIESLKRQLNELRNVDDHDEIAAEALGKSIRALEEARAARELSLRTHERMNALYNEWKAKEASMGLLETRVKKLEVDSVAHDLQIKAVEFTSAALTKTTAFLSSQYAIQAAAIAGIIATLATVAFSIADLYRRIANINSGRDYEQEIEAIRDVASRAYIKADKANREVEIANSKIAELSSITGFRFTRIEIDVKAVKRDIRIVEDNVIGLYYELEAVKKDAVRVFHELNEEIKYLTERSRAAMARLEAFIKSEIASLTSSTLAALLRLQGRIERNESLIIDIQAKANSAIQKAEKAITDSRTAITDSRTAITDSRIAKSDSKTALDKAIGAIEIGDINSSQILDLRIKLASIPQQIKNEIIPTIPPITEEYAKKYAYKEPNIDLGEIKAGYNYSEDYKLDRLQKKLNAEFDQLVKEGFDKLFGGRNPFARLEAISQTTENMRVEFGKLANLQQKAAEGNRTALAEVVKINEQNSKDFNKGVNDVTRFTQQVAELEKKIASPTTIAPQVIEPEIDKKIAPVALKQANTDKEIADIKRRLGERETVDKDVDDKLKVIAPIIPDLNRKLDQIIPMIAGIPIIVGKIPGDTVGKIPGAISPLIPTIPQIGDIVEQKVCNPQCQLPAVSAGNNATNAVNQAKNDIADKIDKTNNAAQTGLLLEILSRLGDKIPGGLSGKLVDGFKWLQLDRILNILTFAATVHNATMLSNDILQTLIGALTNVLTLIVPKDDTGKSFDIGSVINSTVENIVRGIIGAENYTNLTTGWAKANRIYQATTNVLNSFMSLTQTVLQAAEMIAAYTGRIGNALKKGGVVLENAYGWMNPQPKFNRVTQTLESLQNGASTIQMVTQVPLDVVNATTEFTTASTEFVKAIKEDTPANKATPIPEPDELKGKETQSKTDSQPSPFDFSDLFDGED